MAIAFSVLAFAALAVGCGGGDDSSDASSASAPLTKAEFIKQADAICDEASQQSQTEAEEFAKENDFELEEANKKQLEEAVSAVLIPNLNQQAEDIAALDAPAGDEERIEELTASLEDAAAEVEDDPGVVFSGDALAEPGKLAEDYGLKVCGGE